MDRRAAEIKKASGTEFRPVHTWEEAWMGKKVIQVKGEVLGRVGIVRELFWDEKDNLHALVHTYEQDETTVNDFWCPVKMLEEKL